MYETEANHRIESPRQLPADVLSAFGELIGRSDDRFFMKRLPVNSGDDLRFLAAKLEGGYDWLHPSQFAQRLRTGPPGLSFFESSGFTVQKVPC